ncbi:flavin reductase family protein [Streptomyces sp. NPDC060334]|uniref:flavin reductase family protein n=1 Tax=unclassified Streptomyces TaxID=2593676 RepID=UPI0006ADCD68|nr:MULTISPECIES: flavin reductase family protein [unclassified Streptomyces]KOU56556.1 flavin reductase [Streptomyces sp. WM4235]MCX5076815.1 flavin reductase family protein [Streptomyces sp. NBC_00424]MCX5156855.1 flavin reductase family protein [Streptomyces sp. NBC_00291]WUD40172.1 flavin reductase family protein [Streptomyces sp. NBC_00513]
MTAPTAEFPSSTTGRPGSPDLLRSVFRQHAAGVAVITAADPSGRPVGFTATSLNSVSAEPPLLSFTLGTGSSSWPVIRDSAHLGVHILGEHQRELAGLFARGGADRFGPGTQRVEGPHGVPVLSGVLAWLVCRVVARVPAGEHRVIIAEAVAGDPASGPAGEARPLLYHQGRFNALRD